MFKWLRKAAASLGRLFSPPAPTPEEELAKCLSEVKARLPQMNQHISIARTETVRHGERLSSLRREEARILARLSGEDDEIACFELQVRLNDFRAELQTCRGLMKDSDEAYTRMIRIKAAYETEIRRRVSRAMESLERSRAAAWKRDFAGISAELDELVGK